MKKKLLILLLALAMILTIGIVAIAADGEGTEVETITIFYMDSRDAMSTTSSLDKTAYENGKQTVGKGEEFTLPTTTNIEYVGQEGFQLIWYTEDGRTYKAGEKVSFNKDTKLFRCVAKECYTISEVNYAMTNESYAAILMADITTTEGISVRDQDMSALVLNGFTMNFTRNGDIIGNQRSGKQILGEGTINVASTDGKVGSSYVINSQGHSHNGTKNKSVIGRDVTINAPDFWLTQDWDGTNPFYPWIRIYGKIDVYGLLVTSTGPTRNQTIEIYESATVKINGPMLYKADYKSSNTLYYFNNHAIQIRIYGGTFYLPAEAENINFWTDDYKAEYVDGTITYTPRELTGANKDTIKIMGGSFILPDNKLPAISSFLTEDYVNAWQSGGNGLLKNDGDTTFHISCPNGGYYKFVFSKNAYSAPAKLVVTDNNFVSTEYRYLLTKNSDATAVETITIYEASKVVVDGKETTVYETVTDDFVFTLNGSYFGLKSTADYKLQALDVDGVTYQVVVPADCEHSFAGGTVEATCQNGAYAEYNCSKCGHNVFFDISDKLDHNFVLGEHIIEATLTTLGSKTYTCSMCGEVKTSPYSIDPTQLEIDVTIRNDDGTFENITVLASEIFEFSTSGANGDYIYTVSAIKTFGDYKVRNIYGITIPQGILYINISKQNYEKYQNVEYGVTEITIAQGASVYIQNIGNLRRVKKITVEENTNVTFGASCSYFNPANERRDMQIIDTIDLSAGNHTVVFMNNAFDGRGKIANLILGQNSNYGFYYKAFYNCAITSLVLSATNTYVFGSLSFYGNDMAEIVFPNGVDIALGESAFENCPALVNVTFGENAVYTLGNYVFRYCPIPKVVFAKNSTYTLGSQAFLNTALTEVDASAGNITLNLNNNAFNCTKDNNQYCALTVFKLGENSTYVFNEGSLNDTSFTELILAPNSSYTFKRLCMSSTFNKENFNKLDASADNVTVVFEGESFRYNKALAELLVNGKNSSYTFNSSSTFADTIFTELVFGEGSTYVVNNAFNSKLQSIDASADNITLTVNNYGFGKSGITTVLINGKNGNYTFNSEAFRGSNVKELVLGEGSTYNFNGSCFSSTNVLTKIDASASNMTVNFASSVFNGKTALVELDISGENSVYTFGQEAFRNTKITTLKAGQGSSYDFGYRSFYENSVITTVDFSASDLTVVFGNQAFNGDKTISYIAFGENSTYTIGEFAFNNTVAANDIVFAGTSSFTIAKEAFRYADFSSITFEDGCDVTFTGTNAFCDCDKATSLYIGKNIAITNYPFKNFKALETLYIMSGVTHTSEYEFQNAGSSDFSTRLYVYNHSLDFTFSKGTFDNCDGVILYTATNNIGTRTDVFTSCADGTGYKAWTVYLGIPYPVLVNGDIDPTCEEYGYNTYFCDCGHDCGFYLTETTTVNKYENKHNITASTEIAEQVQTYEVTPIDPKGHDTLGTLLDVVYNSFLEKGTGTYICSACGKTHTVENAVDAIFEWLGYSTNADKNEFAIGYRINHIALEQYEALSGNKLVFGVVGAITEKLGGLAPFDEALDPSVKKVSLEIPRENEAGEIAEICFRIQGFKETQMDLGITMAGYVTETTTDEEGNESSTTVYIQSTQTDNPSSNSINNYLASLPTNEEDEVA